ncbi:DUF2520 domain-containing protein [Caballeronia sp. LZ025]|jgi:hypothetical protein|uniref:DUF2520 domain-containing protein n=1 Tax=Caballeronia TaxID=1827195 RepID=UPI001FD1147A|nr:MULTISPECIES: DUF2520 domain-containing protein [Caballeronia]MDR5736190.1 DUF2520 domain-containing protein [Caballeronia sp. LZ025]
MSVEMWQAAGIPQLLIEDMLHTLTRNAAANVVALGPTDALTSPAARGIGRWSTRTRRQSAIGMRYRVKRTTHFRRSLRGLP